jgi:hypothetical protein
MSIPKSKQFIICCLFFIANSYYPVSVQHIKNEFFQGVKNISSEISLYLHH